MISIQTIMLVALGFLSAVLLGLMIFPAFWRRAVRLTAQRLKEQLPLTEAEIKADKDRLRAEYALQVHRLEQSVERAQLDRARQLIEINRRDARISELEQDQNRLSLLVDENQNARRVLEQTVADRLPKIEARLAEARSTLFNRDRDIAELTEAAQRQQLALEEAKSINVQQSSELERLTNALTVRGGRNRQSLADPKYEGELALRAEIEALRSKAREQAGLIGRLQGQMASRTAALPAPARADGPAERASDGPAAELPVVSDKAAQAQARDLRALRSKVEDQAAEIVRLTAELKTLQDPANAEAAASGKDTKIALKARLNAAQAQLETQSDTIKRLRAEVASANERLALQGAHFMEQLRRLGAGTLPASGQTRGPVTQGQKLTLSERVAYTRPPLRPLPSLPSSTQTDEAPAAPSRLGAPAAELLSAPVRAAAVARSPDPAPSVSIPDPPPLNGAVVVPLGVQPALPPPAPETPAAPANDAAPVETSETPPPIRRGRLVDRISSLGKV